MTLTVNADDILDNLGPWYTLEQMSYGEFESFQSMPRDEVARAIFNELDEDTRARIIGRAVDDGMIFPAACDTDEFWDTVVKAAQRAAGKILTQIKEM